MKKYVDNFMQYRFLLSELVKKGIKLKYRRSYLGMIWSMLEPLLTMIVLTIVFGTLYGNTDRTFPVYILTGRLLYSFFSQSTKAALKSIRQNSAMIKKVYVPKYLYPLSSVLFNYVIFLISLIVLAMVSVILGVKPTFYLLQAPIALILILIMSYGYKVLAFILLFLSTNNDFPSYISTYFDSEVTKVTRNQSLEIPNDNYFYFLQLEYDKLIL